MSIESQVTNKVHQTILEYIDQGRTVQQAWIVREVLNQFEDPEGQDADFYRWSADKNLRRVVSTEVRKYKGFDQEADSQMTLEGFERLQRAYSVERKGEQVIVPINQMTTAELDAKIREMEAHIAGEIKHRDELVRYRESRRVRAA